MENLLIYPQLYLLDGIIHRLSSLRSDEGGVTRYGRLHLRNEDGTALACLRPEAGVVNDG